METDCPPGGTGYCGDGKCPYWLNSKCCPPLHPEGACHRCQGRGTIRLDLVKEMNRAERRRRVKNDSQRYKDIPCPECAGKLAMKGGEK